MQSFDTKSREFGRQMETQQSVVAGRVDDLPAGSCKTIDLSEGRELALYNVNGEFYATEDFYPHRSESIFHMSFDISHLSLKRPRCLNSK